MYGFGQWMIYVCVCVWCVCQALMRECMCEKEKSTLCFFKFVLLFSPYKGNIAIKGTKKAGVHSSQGDPSSVKNVSDVYKIPAFTA